MINVPRGRSGMLTTAMAAGLIALGALPALVAALALAACLDRDVVAADPTVTTNFVETVTQTAVDKVDLLLMIDNSTSMGDKQTLLSEAVPSLVQRLVQPNCVDASRNAITAPDGGTLTVDSQGTCASGQPEFSAVHDLHVGIVTSSIGDFGIAETGLADGGEVGDGGVGGVDKAVTDWVCPGNYDAMHGGWQTQNDHAQLINRATGYGPEGAAVSDAVPDNYLSWFPSVPLNAAKTPPSVSIVDQATFGADFQSLVAGVHELGCGYEGQLESWYQFLVQPDPWAAIALVHGPQGPVATFVGLNTTVLQQRHDFLRPDSLVAIIALSDEDDSTVDPGALGATSWRYEDSAPVGRPTSACATNPDDPSCTSCALGASDPACTGPNGTYYTRAEDQPNVRFARMKQRFGVDPQYPVQRYLDGLTSTMVPDRGGEQHDGFEYTPNKSCTNPLFAGSLVDPKTLSATAATSPTASDSAALCALPAGTRSPSLVFFGFIGGVPWQMLTTDAGAATADPNVPFKTSAGQVLSASDWVQIVGNDPDHYDYSGQDPHMQVSTTPRAGIAAGVTASDTADPYNGREYDTQGSDLEYACTFDLPPGPDGGAGKDCSLAAIAADAANNGSQPPYYGNLAAICDCAVARDGGAPPGPLCAHDADGNRTTTQLRGKAYPGIREFNLVHKMGGQGIAASLCPRTIDRTSPDYGYLPAVQSIISVLRNALGPQCVPRKLDVVNGEAPCQVLVLLKDPGPTDDTTCTHALGLSIPAPDILASYRRKQMADLAQEGDGGASLLDRPVCLLGQIPQDQLVNGSCETLPTAGWCYSDSADAASCAQGIHFSASALAAITGNQVNLECLESNSTASSAPP